MLSPDLQQELGEVVLPLTSDAPSESELRLAQAQLVGWLEGLFHGIQATLFTQQAAAQGQLDQMRRRAIEQPPTAADRTERVPVSPGPGASAAEPADGKLFRMQQWTPDSWRALPAEQQPDWPDDDALEARPGHAARGAAAGLRR